MGLADRDYMRERAAERGAATPNGRRTNFISHLPTALAIAAACASTAIVVRLINDSVPRPMTRVESLQTTPTGPTPPVPPPPVAAWTSSDQTQPFPASGTTQWFRPTDASQTTGLFRIMDVSDMRGDKVVRLRDAFGTPVAQTYVQDQEGAQLTLPVGTYHVTIASGGAWYGPERQFGSDAGYYDLGSVEVIVGESNLLIQPGERGGDPLNPINAAAF